MPAFIKGSKKIFFVHIPKTGGSSIEEMMIKSGWQCTFRNTRPAGFIKISPQHYHAELLHTIIDLKKFDFCFSIVRDPVSRFISEYKHRNWLKQNSQLSMQIDINQWAQRVFKAYRHNQSIFDNHLRPQSEFIFPGCHTVPFEHINDTYQILCDVAREELISLPHTNKLPSLRPIEVNQETHDILRNIYREDFNLLQEACLTYKASIKK